MPPRVEGYFFCFCTFEFEMAPHSRGAEVFPVLQHPTSELSVLRALVLPNPKSPNLLLLQGHLQRPERQQLP